MSSFIRYSELLQYPLTLRLWPSGKVEVLEMLGQKVNPPEVYLNLEQLSGYLDKPYKTVVSWVSKGSKMGKLQVVKLFGKLYVSQTTVDEYVKNLRKYKS